MSEAWQTVTGLAAGLMLVWVAVIVALYVFARRDEDPAGLRDMLRLMPDLLKLLRCLATDPDVPRGVRWRLALLIGYLLLPIDLVPDFFPIVGYADDALLVVLGLRSVVRVAGGEALERHWTGTSQGLRVVKRVAGLTA